MTTENINSEEVKETSNSDDLDEVLTLDDLENPESNDLGDAIVSDPENALIDEEKETPAESSTENKPTVTEEKAEETQDVSSDESEDGEENESEDSDLKVVPNESPRERALRLEVKRTKRLLRQERAKKILQDIPVEESKVDLSEEDQEVLSQFDPEQVENMQKLIAISAKKMGFVKKDEFTKEQVHQQLESGLDEWLESHPELDEKNDPDGTLWKQVQLEFSQYVPPKNKQDLQKILNRIHRDIFGITTDTKSLKKVEAKKEKIQVASHSASSGGSSRSNQVEVDHETKSLVDKGVMKGFSDEELAEMGLK